MSRSNSSRRRALRGSGPRAKIHLLADALGRPLRFLLTGGQVHESQMAGTMLDGAEDNAIIADKASDSDAIRATRPSRPPA